LTVFFSTIRLLLLNTYFIKTMKKL